MVHNQCGEPAGQLGELPAPCGACWMLVSAVYRNEYGDWRAATEPGIAVYDDRTGRMDADPWLPLNLYPQGRGIRRDSEPVALVFWSDEAGGVRMAAMEPQR